jgi:flavin reductase (DIM6/NTAB) family NADH-FMN oxidoreductase RutF
MEKISVDAGSFVYPMPVVLVGTAGETHPNFMAVGWVSRVNYRPPLIAVALGKTHLTNERIRARGAFSVNLPGLDLLEKTDHCGLVSGRAEDKSALFEVFYGALDGAPMIRECPLCMECRLFQTVELPSNELFIGEIAGVYTEERYLTDGKPDIRKMRPFTLTMPDNRFRAVGEEAGKAWESGLKLKLKRQE